MSLARPVSSHKPRARFPAESVVYCQVLAPGEPTSASNLCHRLTIDGCGAVVTFEGLVRPLEGARTLQRMDYEAHPVMAQQELSRVCASAAQEFEIERVACEHCTGPVDIEQVSVAIAISSKHRAAAFAACQYILDELKKIVPIWKSPIYLEDIETQAGGQHG